MKNLLIRIICALTLIAATQAPSYAGGYEDAMQKTLALMDSMESVEDMQTIANSFDRIANKEKNQWLPYYYSAFLKVLMTYTDENKENIPSRMDEADAQVTSALTDPNADKSEILCLQSMIASARIMENPMKMGMKYGPMAADFLAQAKTANPDNPRVYLLQGESKYYTPKMWGGSKKEAKELFLVAKEKFQNENPESEITPQWGADRVENYLNEME